MANKHLSGQLLESALDKGLAPQQFEEILGHIGVCAECEQRMEEIESAVLAPYLHFRGHVAPMFPPPPKPWSNVWDEAERVVPAPPRRKAAPRPVWLGAIAALVAAVALFWPRQDSVLHAETLLQKSKIAMAHSPARSRRRLRVRSNAGAFIRPAVLSATRTGGGFENRVEAEFGSAEYNWTDPLSPAAFADWRERRKSKADVVIVLPSPRADAASGYTIRTTVPDGELREASLTIESPAMLPVAARFVFANQDWIEISELSEIAAPLDPALRASAASLPVASVIKPDIAASVPVEIDLASRELRVRAAIDGLDLVAGEPIGIESDDRSQIVVTAYTLSSQDLNRLRASVKGMEGVSVHVEDATPITVGEADPMIDASEAVVSQAHLVNQMAERFPSSIETRLNPEDRMLLWKLRERQSGELNRKIDLLCQQLGKSTRTTTVENESAVEVLSNANSVNRLVTNLYTGGSLNRETERELSVELSRLKQAAHAYSEYVAHSLETLR